MSQRRAQRTLAHIVASTFLKLLRIGYLYCRLGVLHALMYGAPYVPTVLRRTAFLGTMLCVVFELALPVPDFPLWSAMALPVACGALLVAYRGL